MLSEHFNVGICKGDTFKHPSSNILSNGTNIDLEDGMKKTLNLLLADISLLLTEHDFFKLEEFNVKHLTK